MPSIIAMGQLLQYVGSPDLNLTLNNMYNNINPNPDPIPYVALWGTHIRQPSHCCLVSIASSIIVDNFC